MAFILNQLNPIGGQSKATKSAVGTMALWSYFHAVDNLATIVAAGYFNDARNLLTPGDAIIVSRNGAAVDIITVATVPAVGSNVTIQTADINSA